MGAPILSRRRAPVVTIRGSDATRADRHRPMPRPLLLVACAVVAVLLAAPALWPPDGPDRPPTAQPRGAARPSPRPKAPVVPVRDRPDPRDGKGSRDALRRLLVERGVPRRGARRLTADAEWGAFVVERKGPGRSRIGGPAALPRGVAWPQRKGRPLAFVALVDLAELPAFPERGLLPRTGTLTFFAALERLFEPESGNRPERRLRVFYRPASTPIVPARRPRPTGPPPPDAYEDGGVLPSLPIAFRPALTLVDSLFLADFPRYRLGERGEKAYEAASEEWARRSGVPSFGAPGGEIATNSVLGIPEAIQDDPRERDEVSLLNVIPYTFGGEFLDGGSVTFTMRRKDLIARRWSRIGVWPASS